MSYIENLEKEAAKTRTLNGAAAYSASGNACLDLFAVGGGMRYRRKDDIIHLFERAYIETPDLAMKLLFHIRDIREGMGERDIFRTLLRHTARTWPESAEKNVRYISEYGRWDDLLCLLGTPAEQTAVSIIKQQLENDLDAVKRRQEGELNAPVSLLGKWLPSTNTSSARTCRQGKKLMNALGMTEHEYRETLKVLRANSCITEKYLTDKRVAKIRYEAVPSEAMLKYRNAFNRHDEARFTEFIEAVKEGKASVHTDTLFPYEVMKPLFDNRSWKSAPKSKFDAKVLDAIWSSLGSEAGAKNAISVIDTSGSMYCGAGNIKPITVALSLGLYFAERNKGAFNNSFITFSNRPQLQKIQGRTLAEKIRCMEKSEWGMSTNLEAVFELLLKTAIDSDASQEEMPSAIYIISDMEFNQCVSKANKTLFDNAKDRFAAYGYELPAVVFHNVNSWHMQVPVRANTKGAAMTSGASRTAFKQEIHENMTPLSHMLRVLESKRYEKICA